MPNAVDQQIPAKGERPLAWKGFREFKGVYTKSARSAMPEDHFFDLQNLIPLGPANLQVVNNISASLHDFAGDSIYFAQYAQVGSTQYIIAFATNGKVFSYNLAGGATAQINVGKLLSGGASRMTQWMNKYVLFIDSNGYYSWDGAAFTLLNGAQQPVSGTDIATYGGRVFVLSGRLITLTGAYDGTATLDPTANTAWLTANGSTFINLTDPTLTGNGTRLISQNGYLYVFGSSCLYALSDMYVPTGATPPTPVFTITNIQAIIGTDQPASIFPYNRSLMFANRYGAWAVTGVNAERFSENIDGTWQYLSFSPSISGGQCIVNNILCGAFLLQRASDPIFGSNTVIALWFDKKWWFANFGTITFITTAFLSNVPTIFGFIGNKLYSLFTDATTAPNTQAVTPLWGMEDPLSTKEVIRAGVEVTTALVGGMVNLFVDGTSGSSTLAASAGAGVLTFIGAGGIAISFKGLGGNAIVFTTGTYALYSGVSPGVFSHYVGMTMTTNGISGQFSSFFLDYKKGARWV